MQVLTNEQIDLVSGGLDLSKGRMSDNVIDMRGKNMGSYIDASGMCFAPGTSSAQMYPGGADTAPNTGVDGDE